MLSRPFTAYIPRSEASKIDIRPLTGNNQELRKELVDQLKKVKI